MKITYDNRKYETASRWIKLQYSEVTPRSSLYDYGNTVIDENGVEIKELYWFRHNGRKYALNQFMRITSIFYYDKEGKGCCISGCDSESWSNYLLEIDPDGEYVRLWIELPF